MFIIERNLGFRHIFLCYVTFMPSTLVTSLNFELENVKDFTQIFLSSVQ